MRLTACLGLTLLWLTPGALTAQQDRATELLNRADSLFAAGDSTGAAAGYAAVLAVQEVSRALYQLAQLKRAGSAEQVALLRRYAELVPEDPWGHAALGEALLAAGDRRSARKSFDTALALAPDAADIRRRAERVRPSAAGPRLELQPQLKAGGDSDGNRLLQSSAFGSLRVGERTTLMVSGARLEVSDPYRAVSGWEAAAGAEYRDAAGIFAQARAGVLEVSGADGGSGPGEVTGSVRFRWRREDGAGVDGLARREPINATPQLYATTVLSEARLVADVSLLPHLRARGVVRIGRLETGDSSNVRTGFMVGPVLQAAPGIELNVMASRTGFAHATSAGYFAPEELQLLEAGTYFERYWGPLGLALDAGIGGVRVTRFREEPGSWQRSLRLWSQLSRGFGSTGALLLEIEAYDTGVAQTITAALGAWRYGSAALTWRLRL